MNLIKYIIAVLIAQTVKCNSISSRNGADDTRTEDEIDTKIGVRERGDYRQNTEKDPRELLSPHDVILHYPSNDIMSSSDLLLHAITSPKLSTTTLLRVKRGSKSPRKKKCDPATQDCKRSRRNRRKNKNKSRKGGRKKCKKGKKGKKKRCRKTPRVVTSKPPPVNFTSTHPLSPVRSQCIRTTDCPKGYCCARHHDVRVCKPTLREGDICTRPKRKNRRNVDRFEMCLCDEGLSCERKTPGSRLHTCQRKAPRASNKT